MSFSIKIIPAGPLDVNCYVLKDEDTSKGVIIDPGGDGPVIASYVKKAGIDVQLIINTHGHWDHIGAVDELRKEFNVPVAIHKLDKDMLTNPRGNLSSFLGADGSTKAAEQLLQDGDEIVFGNSRLKVIHTPGHTPGGICLYDGADVLFSGDTLFYFSVGRTDFPGGSSQELIRSITERLADVSDTAKVYPGHGPATVMGNERRGNPFL